MEGERLSGGWDRGWCGADTPLDGSKGLWKTLKLPGTRHREAVGTQGLTPKLRAGGSRKSWGVVGRQEGAVRGALGALQAGCWLSEVTATANSPSACSGDTFARFGWDAPLPLFTATACPAGRCFPCEPHGHTQVRGAGWLCERPRFPFSCSSSSVSGQCAGQRLRPRGRVLLGDGRRHRVEEARWRRAHCDARGATPDQDLDNALVFHRHQSTGRRCSRPRGGKIHVSTRFALRGTAGLLFVRG